MLRSLSALSFLLLCVALCGSSCRGDRDARLRMDTEFSVNLVEVPSDFPLEDKDWAEDPRIALQQQQVYARHGAPDYFRLRWRRDGQLMTRAELFKRSWTTREDKMQDYAMEKSTEIEWLYLDSSLVYRFDPRKPRAESRPLEDWLRTVSMYGDPEEVKQSRDIGGPNMIFHYHSEGKIFYYRENGKQYNEDTVPAMPAYIMRD